MYSPKEVQKATNAIISALEKRQLKEHSIHQYAQHYQELNTYIENNGVISVDEVTFRDFLVYQYGVHILSLHARGFDGIAGGHIRPLAILNWYLVTGEVDSRARVRTPPFICPEGFCDSYDAFMNYLHEKGLSYSTIHNYRETVQQMIRHMIAGGIEATDMISPAGILSFLATYKHFSTNSFGYLLTGIRQYLTFYTGPLVKTTKRENIVNHGSLGYGIDFAAGGRA